MSGDNDQGPTVRHPDAVADEAHEEAKAEKQEAAPAPAKVTASTSTPEPSKK